MMIDQEKKVFLASIEAEITDLCIAEIEKFMTEVGATPQYFYDNMSQEGIVRLFGNRVALDTNAYLDSI
jgi:hypothetical protein